jgi:hypothetical protein
LGYGKEGDGEFSKTTEVREASNEEFQILHKPLVLPEQPSSPGKASNVKHIQEEVSIPRKE